MDDDVDISRALESIRI